MSKRVRIRKNKPGAKKKTHQVKDLSLGEVSFVDKGDNPAAHILLMKRKITTEEVLKTLPDFLRGWVSDEAYDINKQGAAEFLTILKSMDAATFADMEGEQELRQGVFDRIWTLERSISSILEDDDVTDKTNMIQQSVIEFQQSILSVTKQGGVQMDALKELLAKLKKDNPKATDEDLMKLAAEALVKSVEDLAKEKEDLAKANTSLEAEKGDLVKKVEDLEKNKGTEGPVKIDKAGLAPEVLEALEKGEKTEARLEKMEKTNRIEKFNKRAAEVSSIGDVDEVSIMLAKIDEHDSDLADEVQKILASAHTIIVKSPMFKEIGGSGDDDSGTAIEKLNALAADLRKTETALTQPQAFTKVYNDPANVELVKQYKDER